MSQHNSLTKECFFRSLSCKKYLNKHVATTLVKSYFQTSLNSDVAVLFVIQDLHTERDFFI